MLLSDSQIAHCATRGMITPFSPELVRTTESGHRALSYGLSSYGYDIRLSDKEFYTFTPLRAANTEHHAIIDPKDFNPAHLTRAPLHHDPERGSYFVMPALSYGLGVALEKLNLPEDITALFIGKSSYARCGLIANLTPGEAGWRGHLTLEFSNSASCPCRVYANEGIVQALFFRGEPCNTSYQTRAGKYQDQPHGVITARL
jgi:dCTP deaminase